MPGNAKASLLTDSDWQKILGKDPIHYDYTGIDPHMIESYQPRPGLPPPGSVNMGDPAGHEWITDSGMGHILEVDREYACIFDLVDATGTPAPRDCTQMQNQNFCDCPHTAGSVSAAQLPPICDPNTITRQTGAKAYPTIRELLLAKLMGTNGIVSSICPQHAAEMGAGDPLYGYRPAVAVIVDRLKTALNNQCLPQPLIPDKASGVVQCLVLVQMPLSNGGTCKNPVCNAAQGLIGPTAMGGNTIAAGQTLDQGVLNQYCDNLEAKYQQQVQAAQASGVMPGIDDPANLSVCALKQLTSQANPADFPSGGSCAAAMNTRGWCYVTGSATGTNCAFAVIFTPSEPPAGSTANLQCLEQVTSVLDGG
jgi:hypothetical protein